MKKSTKKLWLSDKQQIRKFQLKKDRVNKEKKLQFFLSLN
jgi:hypothetical protein